MNMDDFNIRTKDGIIEIEGEPEVLRAVCHVISIIHDVLKLAEKKAEVARHAKRAKMEASRIAERADFEARAVEIYKLYLRHFNNGCGGNARRAVDAVRADLGILAVDVRGFIREGKRLYKREVA